MTPQPKGAESLAGLEADDRPLLDKLDDGARDLHDCGMDVEGAGYDCALPAYIAEAAALIRQQERRINTLVAAVGEHVTARSDLRAASEHARGALNAVVQTLHSKGLWRNEAGYLTDLALWVDRAIDALSPAQSPPQIPNPDAECG